MNRLPPIPDADNPFFIVFLSPRILGGTILTGRVFLLLAVCSNDSPNIVLSGVAESTYKTREGCIRFTLPEELKSTTNKWLPWFPLMPPSGSLETRCCSRMKGFSTFGNKQVQGHPHPHLTPFHPCGCEGYFRAGLF